MPKTYRLFGVSDRNVAAVAATACMYYICLQQQQLKRLDFRLLNNLFDFYFSFLLIRVSEMISDGDRMVFYARGETRETFRPHTHAHRE